MPLVTIDKSVLAGLGSDIALLKTSDGKPMVDLWNEVIVPGVNDYNTILNALAEFMAYKSDQRIDQVTQSAGSKWQRGDTEVTKAASVQSLRHFMVRTAIESYKTYLGWTKKYISKVNSATLVAHFNAQLKALTEQKYMAMLSAFYNKGERDVFDADTHEALKATCLVDGTGNWPIPPMGLNAFADDHSHFAFIDATASDWTDAAKRQAQIKSLIKLVTEHGFRDNLILMGQGAVIDNIQACPGYRGFVDLSPFGESNPAALKGSDTQATIKVFRKVGGLFRVLGTLENATVIEGDIVPTGYISCFSYQGANSESNPVQWRERPIESFTTNPFPFYETNLETWFGASVRQRLNGAHLYVANGATEYVNPTALGSLGAAAGDWNGQ